MYRKLWGITEPTSRLNSSSGSNFESVASPKDEMDSVEKGLSAAMSVAETGHCGSCADPDVGHGNYPGEGSGSCSKSPVHPLMAPHHPNGNLIVIPSTASSDLEAQNERRTNHMLMVTARATPKFKRNRPPPLDLRTGELKGIHTRPQGMATPEHGSQPDTAEFTPEWSPKDELDSAETRDCMG